MKQLAFSVLVALQLNVCPLGSPLAPPQEEDVRVGGQVDFDKDSQIEFDMLSVREGGPAPEGGETYEVGVTLRNHHPNLFLRSTSTRIQFREGEAVSSKNLKVSDDWGSNWIPVGDYLQRRFPGTEWTFADPLSSRPPTYWSTETNLLIGCKLYSEDGVHYGWIRLTRPDRNFLTQYDVATHDWNPLPGEPIRAGLPPEIPLASEAVAEGISVRWPVAIGLATWVLESSDSLGPDAEWVPIPEAANGEILLEPPESMRFYRLRRP